MALLTKKDILEKDDKRTVIVDVPEWGGEVKICSLSGYDKDQYETSCLDANGKIVATNIRAKLVAASIVNDNNEKLFRENEVHKLGEKSGLALDRVFTAAMALNKITDDTVEADAKN